MPISNRYDFVLLFDVKDGNPNGDPDAGNLPRLDAETGHGLVTDVSLKRKVRNFVGMVKDCQRPYDIYVKEKGVLERLHREAYKEIGASDELADDKDGKDAKKKRKGSEDSVRKARDWMCQNFFDVRTFGAVMSTGVNCGQVRGPVQLTFARSADPVIATEHSITRMAVATEAESERQEGDNRTMGRKHTVPYGLYRAHGFVSSFLAKQTGFGEEDLALLWQSLGSMFEHDRSAARGEMSTRGLYVFKHQSELGNAHAHALFDMVKTHRLADVPRSFADYRVDVGGAGLPAGVELQRLVG
ncbi:type I-C CRISPR-associated protein Cas7/Csd2 [Pseudorhodoferax sp. Leaf274]|uniref:type I-C CRISPR-associated protein Cas7/Csd2 n=1 Tax=Pseudorhodoferax sp. Leaf274 TaxID=1736318 RepID=UPI000702ECCB|nr:type I-C CRISPR-associated protein Cas7/Csd2 [Pseudorhodoferax sp. Leaf274]KQP38073.1 type I-C CRISPR-associated protein Cas7/Csd2 [Pseudorhodoferax sp. Leaf274]